MKRLLFASLLIAAAASAQVPFVPPTPEAQALAQKLMAEINANIACTAAGISLNQQLVAAQAEIKRLKDKPEPKKDEPK